MNWRGELARARREGGRGGRTDGGGLRVLPSDLDREVDALVAAANTGEPYRAATGHLAMDLNNAVYRDALEYLWWYRTDDVERKEWVDKVTVLARHIKKEFRAPVTHMARRVMVRHFRFFHVPTMEVRMYTRQLELMEEVGDDEEWMVALGEWTHLLGLVRTPPWVRDVPAAEKVGEEAGWELFRTSWGTWSARRGDEYFGLEEVARFLSREDQRGGGLPEPYPLLRSAVKSDLLAWSVYVLEGPSYRDDAVIEVWEE